MQSRVAAAIRQEHAGDAALDKAVGAYLDTLTGPARDVLDIDTGEKPRLLADPTLWRAAVVMHLVGGQQGAEHTDAEAVEMLQRVYGVPTLSSPGSCAAEVGTWIRRADHHLGGGVFARVRDGAWRNLTG
jgi:hypothetical protein